MATLRPDVGPTDPYGRHQLRYWDGRAWTGHVSDDGVQGIDEPQSQPANAASDDGFWWSSRQRVATYYGSHPRLTGERNKLTVGMIADGFFVVDNNIDPVITLPWQRSTQS